jgi:Type I restriction enzyme R protein N terminus (HSDR_N)
MMQAPEQLFCQVRQEWVKATPEEKVRQHLVYIMKYHLGYPSGGLTLEASLNQMPHLALYPDKLPNRRADVVYFAPNIHPKHALYPLLLIECKAIKLSSKVVNQVLGYNHYLQACFIAIANQDKVQTGWFDRNSNQYVFIDSLPSYESLLASRRKRTT